MKVTVVDRPDDWRFEEAGGHHAEAFVLVSEDDAANVAAWLAVRAMWPDETGSGTDRRRAPQETPGAVRHRRPEQGVCPHRARPVAVGRPGAAPGGQRARRARPLNVPDADLLVGKPLPGEAGPEDNEGFEPLLGLFGQTERPPGSSSAQLADRRETTRVKRRQWNVRFRKRDRVAPLTESDVVVLPPKDSPRTRLVLGRWKQPSRRRGRHLPTTAELASPNRDRSTAGRVCSRSRKDWERYLAIRAGGPGPGRGGRDRLESAGGRRLWLSVFQTSIKALNGVEPASAGRTTDWQPWMWSTPSWRSSPRLSCPS